ncbi:MAG: ABC transporter substrate-binding protein [Candidatus Latescibacteria bacterium]|nr:ABC transporter substrate-binding protein [Candidatus Latescibacterota bacterium]
MAPIRPLHPAVLDAASDCRNGRMDRRAFIRLATLLGASAAAAQVLVACADQPPPLPQSTALPDIPRRGGTLKIGSVVQRLDHPARLSWVEGANQVRQVAEYLTETGPDNITRPHLLDRWEADRDLRTWTLHLRRDIRFSDGQPLEAADLLFNFNQWLNPDIGSSMLGLLSYLQAANVETVDAHTVRLHLDQPQLGVPEHLFHYPALILPRSFEGDFVKQPVGTGPFRLLEYTETERAVMERRPDYWRQAPDGQPLPYLDKLIYLDLEPDARVAAMQAGQLDTLYQPRPSDWQALKNVPGLKVEAISTAQAFVLRMRVDQEPWNDVRVRNALKLCQDRSKILRLAYFDQGDLGLDAHVAPVHPAYCPQDPPAYDPERARALLAEAGYPDGLRVTLTTKNDLAEPEMAQALKELAAPAGFDLDLDIVEPSAYWDRWTEVGLGITAWAHRPLGTMALALAYTADEAGTPGPWNESRWTDAEFADLLRTAERTLDVDQRRATMCQIEQIMQQRGPIGIPFWRRTWTISRDAFINLRAHPTSYDLFSDVWQRA